MSWYWSKFGLKESILKTLRCTVSSGPVDRDAYVPPKVPLVVAPLGVSMCARWNPKNRVGNLGAGRAGPTTRRERFSRRDSKRNRPAFRMSLPEALRRSARTRPRPSFMGRVALTTGKGFETMRP